MNIEQLFEQEGERLMVALEKLNEIGDFGGTVSECIDEWGYDLFCPTWTAQAAFSDAYDFGDSAERGQYANVTVFCTGKEGRVLPSYQPLNFTESVWCNLNTEEGVDEILSRLVFLENNLEEFAQAIKERLEEIEREEPYHD